jgi:filamentous hemagglutinin family protein
VINLFAPPIQVIAQVISAPDEIKTRVETRQNQFEITGGTTSRDGGNLFHSFDRFNLTRDQVANFTTNAATRNIFARIRDREASLIDGALRVSGSSANLFLMNPAGLIFGPSVRLNLPGIFSATTATGINFNDGQWNVESNNPPTNLLGSPQALVFALNQPGAIINSGNLTVQPGQAVSLTGGTVINTGDIKAPSGQVTIAAISGQNQIKISQPGSILSLQLAMSPRQTWTPETVVQLLTKGSNIRNAPKLQINAQGQVELRGSGLTIPDRPGSTVQTGTIDVNSAAKAGDGGNVLIWSDRDTLFQGKITARGGTESGNGGNVEISGKAQLKFDGMVDVLVDRGQMGKVLLDPQDIIIGDSTIFSQVQGELELNADRLIWLQRTSDTGLNLGEGGKVTFRAGTEFRADTTINSAGRSIEIQAPLVTTQTINTTLGADRAGSVTITGTNGELADTINTANIITPNQDVKLRGKSITNTIILTGTDDRPGNSFGKVNIESLNRVQTSAILTSGQDVNLNSKGTIQVGPILTFGGNVTIGAAELSTGLVWTSPNSTGNAGNITLNTIGDLRTRQLEANGKAQGRSGTVSVKSDRGDVVIDSIQAFGGGGGKAILQSNNVQITGVRYEELINPDGSTGFDTSSIKVDDSINITHRGGNTNQPFIIGDPTYNGSNGKLVAGGKSLSTGQFAIQANTVNYQPLPGITITSENHIPVFPGLDKAKLLQRNVEAGSQTTFTLAQLGLKTPQDADADRTQLYLRIRPSSRADGAGKLLDTFGRVITKTAVRVRMTDRLTYLAPDGTGLADTYEVIATDNSIDPIGTLDQYPRIALRLDSPPIPQVEPPPPPPTKPTATLPEGTPLSNVSAQEVAKMDEGMSQEFADGGIAGPGKATPPDGMVLMRQVEAQSRARPALVYLRTQLNELEITMVTARGRFRKRVPVSRDRLTTMVTAFRREVTNPLKTHTQSYLAPAKQLYEWMIAPIYTDLYSQGITNVVFLPESGLRSLPYSALHNGHQFLMEQFSVALMPSLGLTKIGYQSLRDQHMLAIGISESTQDQNPLPMVQAELSALEQIWPSQTAYLNQTATLETLQNARKKKPFQIVHLATHANFNAASAKNAYIQLWNDRLKLEDIRQLGWNEPPVELLVLSACRTAIGNHETELGFAGLALQTGVKTAVASLWYVNDTATTGLISQFYETLKTTSVRAEALRQTQIAMANGVIIPREDKLIGLSNKREIMLPIESQVNELNFKHPYFWAAFTMIGNPW